MEATFVWLTIALLALCAYGPRAVMIVLASHLELPPAARRMLRYVPPAVLSALIVPALVMPAGTPDLGPGNAHLWAGVAGAATAWRTGNVLLTIGVGMAALHGLRALG